MQTFAETDSVTVAPASGYVRLIVVLVLLTAITPLARLVLGVWIPPGSLHQRANLVTDFIFYARYGAAYLCGGLLIDHFGVRRVVGLALIGWCVLVPIAAAVTEPVSLGAIHLLVTLVYGVVDVAPAVAVKRGVARGATAPAVMIPAIAAVVSLGLTTPLHDVVAAGSPGGPVFGRMWPALVAATLCALLTFVWLVVYPARHDTRDDPRPDSALTRLPILLADRKIHALLVLMAVGVVIFAVGEQRMPYFLARERGISQHSVGLVVFLPYLAAMAAGLASAIWSDRILLDTGSLVAARRPFVAAGFALSAALALVPFVRQQDTIAMMSIAAAGMGIQTILSVVAIDIAPSDTPGTFIGIVSAFGSLVRFGFGQLAIAVYWPARSLVPIIVIGGLVALAGAFAAYRLLRRIEPVADPAARPEIPSIFA